MYRFAEDPFCILPFIGKSYMVWCSDSVNTSTIHFPIQKYVFELVKLWLAMDAQPTLSLYIA